jgi:formylglycine-generating enzyme required for sulfatase activity
VTSPKRGFVFFGVAVALLLVSAPVTPDTPVTEDASAYEGMVLVPAGEFLMGSLDSDHAAEADEKPQRVVQLPDFYIDEFEISNIEYKRFIDATGYPPPPTWEDAQYEAGADFYPVTHVTWWDAVAYARWVGKRLPSEAEWEKAARGPEGRRYPWGEEFDAGLANAGDGYAPISSFLGGVSVYGAQNMAGNVAEWTSSTYEPSPELEAVLPTNFGGTDSANAAARPTREKARRSRPRTRRPPPEVLQRRRAEGRPSPRLPWRFREQLRHVSAQRES